MTKEGEERGKKRAKMKSRNAVKEEKCTEGLGKGVLGWVGDKEMKVAPKHPYLRMKPGHIHTSTTHSIKDDVSSV